MAQYKFKEDFYNTETSKVGSTDRTPIFKAGDIIDTEKVDNLRMNEEGIFYPFNDVNACLIERLLTVRTPKPPKAVSIKPDRRPIPKSTAKTTR